MDTASKLVDSLSVVVPVYNSEQILPLLVNRLQPVLTALTPDYELVLVNDGSCDGSWAVIQQLAAEHSWVRGINLRRNYGQHSALLCGIRSARHEVIVTMDDDLQHPPEELPRLLMKVAEGFDVVYGAPAAMPHSLLRNFLSRGTKWILGMAMGLDRMVDISAFRACRTNVRDGFATFRSPNPMIDVLLSWGTDRFASVVVRHEPRKIGRSNYSVFKLFNQAMLLITGFTTGPLRLASWVGFAFTLFGLGVLLYVTGHYFLYGSMPGFPFLASIISIFSGAQLFAVGIIGEYLARIFARTLERPSYVIGAVVPHCERMGTVRTA